MAIYTYAVCICLLSWLADYFYNSHTLAYVPYHQIIVDVLCHQGIAILTWLIYAVVSNQQTTDISTIMLNQPHVNNTSNHNPTSSSTYHSTYIWISMFCGTIVDIDHILSTKTWTLHDAVRLQHRPIGHSIALVIVICIIHVCCPWDANISTVYSLSSLSHLIRDSSRRGLWFCFGFKTRPLPYVLHLVLLCVLPYLVFYVSYPLEIMYQWLCKVCSHSLQCRFCCRCLISTQNDSKWKASHRKYHEYYKLVKQSKYAVASPFSHDDSKTKHNSNNNNRKVHHNRSDKETNIDHGIPV